MKKSFVSIALVTILACIMTVSVFAAQSSFEWSFQPGLEGVTIINPQSAVTLTNTTGMPVQACPIDKEFSIAKTDYADDEINFKLKITPNITAKDIFLGLFTLRNNDPGTPCWGPGVNAITVEFFKGKVNLTAKKNGGGVSEAGAVDIDVADGNVHTINIKINDATKTVSLIIDGQADKKLDVTFLKLEKEGGYQIYAQKSTVEMTEFKATNSKTVAISSTVSSTTSSTAPTSSSIKSTVTSSNSTSSSVSSTSTNSQIISDISEISERLSDEASTTEESSKSNTPDNNKSGNMMLIIIIVGAVVILGGAGAAAYFLILKK